jgi:hypothetical protein
MPEQQDLRGAIRPTLFLGLGGTGKEVLLRVRRKFYERLGVLGLDCTAYLWLDTDTRNCMAVGEKIDETFSAVAFQPDEMIELLSGSVKEDLVQIFKSRDFYRHIHQWLPPEVQRYGTEIADGAGGVRTVGRLTYFHHFAEKIDPILGSVIENVRSHDRINKTKQFFTDRKLGAVDVLDSATQVVLVSSLAGGTGCGTFLDAAFHLRDLAKAKGIERVIGMLFMPNVFYANAASEVALRSFGNAYAALKELEFYTLRLPKTEADLSVDFEVEWERGKAHSVVGPPFAISYILEMKNEGAIPMEPRHRPEVFDVVAESLFLDFMPGPFSTQKRSNYSNVAQNLAGTSGTNIAFDDVVLPQAFARRYASCGMSKIEIPVDQIKAACASYLAYAVAGYINRDSADPRIGDNVRGDMARLELDGNGFVKRFGTEWKDAIRTGLGAAIPKSGMATMDRVDELERQIKETEERMINAEGPDPVRWGSAIQMVRNQTGAVTQKVNENLLRWVRDTLENDSRGLKALVSERKESQADSRDGYLRHMLEYLKDLYAASRPGVASELDQRIAEANGDAKYYAGRRDGILMEIRQAVRSTGLVLLRRAEWVKEALLQRLREAEEQYCLASVERCVLECAKKVAEAAVDGLAKRRQPLEALSTAVASAAQKFLETHDKQLSFGESVLLVQFFDRAADWPRFYRLDVNEQGQAMEVDPRTEYRKFLTHGLSKPATDGLPKPQTADATLWDLVELFTWKGERELRSKLRDYAERRFFEDFEAHPRQIDVLSHPQLRENWRDAVERLVRSAMPLARRDKTLGGRAVQVEKKAYVGVPGLASGAAQEEAFKEEVKKHLQAKMGLSEREIDVEATGKPYEVYLYMVVYAFPLSSLPVVTRDCHTAYHDFYRTLSSQRSQIPLHLDVRWEGKFDDLVVYDDAVAQQIKEAREVLLFGALLKVLEVTDVQGRTEYQYNSGPPFYKQRALGPKREAVDALQNDRRQREEFRQTLLGREQLLKDKALETYYWALQYLSRADDFPDGSTEFTLLEQRIGQVYARLVKAGVAQSSLDLQAGAPAAGATENTGDAKEKAKATRAKAKAEAEFARSKINDDVEWSCGLPILKDAEKWTATGASAS